MVTTATAFPSVVDHLVEQVFQRILAGEYAPGARLTEEQLAATFGASRTPVREAVRRLAELGLVTMRPRCGCEVATVSEDDIREIRTLRAELEVFALRLAMQHIDPAALARLETLQQSCEREVDGGNRLEVFRRDSAFHLSIAQLSGNRYLHDTLRRLDARVLLCRMLLCRTGDKIRDTVAFHRIIIDAMERSDTTGAEQAMRRHIEETQM